MKRIFTAIAAILAVAIVVIAAAPDTNGAGTGTVNDPKYIVGDVDNAYDIGNGVVTKIKYNANSFSENAEHTFKIFNGDAATGVDLTIGDETDLNNYKFTLTRVGEVSDGTYEVKIISTPASAESKFKIGAYVKEKWTPETTPIETIQEYYWGFHVTVEDVDAIITLKENTAEINSNNYAIPFEKKVDITIGVTNEAETALTGYSYYATNLPAGLSVTTQGHISGKLSSSIAGGTHGTFKVTAVSENRIIDKDVSYIAGDHPSKKDLTFKINGADNPKYAIVNSGGKVTVTDVKIGEVEVDQNKLTVSFAPLGSQSSEWTTDNKLVIDSELNGLGSFRVDLIYKDTDNGIQEVKVSFQVFVVGGIYDSNIDPTVQGKVNG